MPIVSSSYAIDAHQQQDGGRYVRETHTDNTGKVYDGIIYRLPAGAGTTEADAFLAQHAASLDVQLAEAESEALIGD